MKIFLLWKFVQPFSKYLRKSVDFLHRIAILPKKNVATPLFFIRRMNIISWSGFDFPSGVPMLFFIVVFFSKLYHRVFLQWTCAGLIAAHLGYINAHVFYVMCCMHYFHKTNKTFLANFLHFWHKIAILLEINIFLCYRCVILDRKKPIVCRSCENYIFE